jgi:hypothetical protein
LYHRIENKRFLNSEYNQGNGNGIGGADLFRDIYPPGGSNGTAADIAKNCFNRFIALTYNNRTVATRSVFFNYNSGTPANGRYSSQADAHNAYLNSSLSLNIARGTTANTRVGRDINVYSDNWEFRVSIPKVYPGATNWDANTNNDERIYRVRLVGIMQHTLERPGQIGFAPDELFENPLDIHTKFAKDDAQGYSVVFDQQRRISASGFVSIMNHSSVPAHAVFKTKLAYLRRYSDGTTNGYETELDGYPTDSSPEGVMKGQVTWYIFIEDDGNAHVSGVAKTNDMREAITNPGVARIEVIRNTFWTDP